MESEMYVVRGSYDHETVTEPLYTDKEHLERCASEAAYLVKAHVEFEGLERFDKTKVSVYYNKAVMCFGGYLVNGDYVGKLTVKL